MGGRYLRTFDCTDCGLEVTRKWHTHRPKLCYPCAFDRQIRHNVARANEARRRRGLPEVSSYGAPIPPEGAHGSE